MSGPHLRTSERSSTRVFRPSRDLGSALGRRANRSRQLARSQSRIQDPSEVSSYRLCEAYGDCIPDLGVLRSFSIVDPHSRISRTPQSPGCALPRKLIPVRKELQSRPLSNSQDSRLAEVDMVIRQRGGGDIWLAIPPLRSEDSLRKLPGLEAFGNLAIFSQHVVEFLDDFLFVLAVFLFC